MSTYFLSVHIIAGTLSLVAGAASLITSKGSYWHRKAGNLFCVSMVIMSVLGVYASFDGQILIDILGGSLAFYLVTTSWLTVIRSAATATRGDIILLVLAIVISSAYLTLAVDAYYSEDGLRDGFSFGVYLFFGSICSLAALGDWRMISSGGVSGQQRISRHLWRMCFALFIATASLFLGQAQVFPEAIQGSAILFAPVLLVLIIMLFWMVKLAWGNKASVTKV